MTNTDVSKLGMQYDTLKLNKHWSDGEGCVFRV